MNPHVLLLTSLVTLASVSVVLVAVTAAAKVYRARRVRSLARLTDRHRRLVLEVASGEDEDDLAWSALAALPERQWRGLRASVVVMFAKVRGAPAERLVALLDRHGDLERARHRLGSRSGIRRARAASLLGLARDVGSVPDLVGLLHDPAPDVRLVAVRALGRIGDASAAAALLAAVPGRGARVGLPAWAAAEALLAMGTPAEPAVAAGLLSPQARVRDVAVTVTGHSQLPRALDVVRECLHFETDLGIKGAMIEALGRMGGTEDVALIAGYTGRYAPSDLRRACVRALGELGDREALARLGRLLGDEDRATAALAADALAERPCGRPILEAARTQDATLARVVAAALHRARLRSVAGAGP